MQAQPDRAVPPEWSLFYGLDLEAHLPTIYALKSMDVERGFRELAALHSNADERLRAGGDGRRRERVRALLKMSTIFTETNIDSVVESYVAYRSHSHLTRIFSALFLEKLRPLCQIEGIEELEAVQSKNEKIILAPFHVRHYGALVAIVVGFGHPVTLMQMQVPGIDSNATELAWGDFDVDTASPTDPLVLVRCITALRRGRLLVWPPEFYYGSGRPDLEMMFLSCSLPMSRSLPGICRRERAVTIPCYATATWGSPIIRVVFGPAIPPPEDKAEDGSFLQALSDYYGETMRAEGAEVEWMGWDPIVSGLDPLPPGSPS